MKSQEEYLYRLIDSGTESIERIYAEAPTFLSRSGKISFIERIVAMANTFGGFAIFGMKSEGEGFKLIGMDKQGFAMGALESLVQEINELIRPKLDADCFEVTHQFKKFFILQIKTSNKVPHMWIKDLPEGTESSKKSKVSFFDMKGQIKTADDPEDLARFIERAANERLGHVQQSIYQLLGYLGSEEDPNPYRDPTLYAFENFFINEQKKMSQSLCYWSVYLSLEQTENPLRDRKSLLDAILERQVSRASALFPNIHPDGREDLPEGIVFFPKKEKQVFFACNEYGSVFIAFPLEREKMKMDAVHLMLEIMASLRFHMKWCSDIGDEKSSVCQVFADNIKERTLVLNSASVNPLLDIDSIQTNQCFVSKRISLGELRKNLPAIAREILSKFFWKMNWRPESAYLDYCLQVLGENEFTNFKDYRKGAS